MTIAAIIFDFDGVLLESEYAGNVHIAHALTDIGHPTTIDEALAMFTGVGGQHFLDAVAGYIGRPIPDAFMASRRAEDARVLAEGLDAVAGAVDFIRSLPTDLPRAIASSSTTHWITTHLDHLGLRAAFGDHIYSGREHVTHGKPAPDIYLHAAAAIGVPIERTLIIEDSPVGIAGAVASGARVVGLAAGQHCGPGHADTLRAAGAAHVVSGFDAIARLLDR